MQADVELQEVDTVLSQPEPSNAPHATIWQQVRQLRWRGRRHAQVLSQVTTSGPRPPSPLRRVAVSLLSVASALLILGLAAYGLLLLRLSHGPIELDSLGPRVVEALQQRFGDAYQFSLKQASLKRVDGGFSLQLDGMSVRDANGNPVVDSPSAQLSVDPLSLAVGNLVPRQLEVRGADLRLSILPDGKLAISAGGIGKAAIPIADGLPGLASAEETRNLSQNILAPEGSSPAAHDVADGGVAEKGVGPDRLSGALLAIFDLATKSDSPLSALDKLGFSHGRLTVEGMPGQRSLIFEDVDVAIERKDAQMRLALDVDGPNGRWKGMVQAGIDQNNQRALKVELNDLSLDDMALLFGQGSLGFVLDTPISLRFEAAFDADGKVVQGSGRAAIGAGLFKIADRDSEPLLVDEITGDFRLDPERQALVLENWQYFAAGTHFVMDGVLILPRPGDPVWKFDLATRPGGSWGAERPGEANLAIDHIELTGTASTQEQVLAVDKLKISGRNIDAEFSLQAKSGDAPRLQLAGSARATDLLALIRLWPSQVAPPVRAWGLKHIMGGTVDKASVALDFDAATMDLLANDRAVPDEDLHIELAISNGVLNVLPGAAPLAGLSATVLVSGRKASLAAQSGFIETSPGHRLEIGEGRFVVADTSLHPAPASFNARFAGGLDALGALLATESLKPFANLPLDPAAVRGQIDGKLGLEMKLGKPSTVDDTQVRVAANLTNFVVEKLIGKEKLDTASLSLNFDRNGIRAVGQGRMFGQNAQIELKKASGETGEAVINLTIDEAARGRLGISTPSVTGPIAAKIVAKLGQVGETDASVDLDFLKTGMDGLFPGFAKPPGKPAKASFKLSADKEGTLLEPFSFDGGGASLRGSVELDGDGGLASAKFSQMKLAASDDIRSEITRSGDGLKIVVRGNSLDARPFLQGLFNGNAESGRDSSPRDAELDIKVGQAIGLNKQVMTGMDLKLVKKAGQIRQLLLGGKLGAAPVSANMAPVGQINLKSDNAGATLAFVDFYRRMEGGDLTATLHPGANRSDGSVLIHDFLLRDEPALRRLVTEGANVRDDRSSGQGARFDPGLIEFQKLQVSFVKTGGRIELQNGIMYGPQIGTSLEGVVDFPKNFVDVKGTFVPAYGLNNIFARIPLLGPLLGGGTHEGLFAVNFRISGPASGPTLNINPLSALAPGFLRKIFGAGDIPAGFQTGNPAR